MFVCIPPSPFIFLEHMCAWRNLIDFSIFVVDFFP